MSFVKKISVTMVAFASSKTASAAAASGAVVAAAAGLGLDWMPWAVGAAGSTVVYAYKPPTKRSIALANGVISVMLGGVGGPFAVSAASEVFDAVWLSTFNNILLSSFALAAAWPWIAPKLWSGLVGMWNGFTQGVSRRQGGGQ